VPHDGNPDERHTLQKQRLQNGRCDHEGRQVILAPFAFVASAEAPVRSPDQRDAAAAFPARRALAGA